MRTAETFKLALFQHAQQLGLRRHTHIADFIQKDRAAMCRLKLALALIGRACERTFFVAEQFRFNQFARHRGAVHRNELALPTARALVVNGARDQFFARAGFAANQHRNFCRRDFGNQVIDLLHAVTGAEQIARAFEGGEFFFQPRIFCAQTACFQRVFDDKAQFIQFIRLGEIIVRACFDGFDGGAFGAVRGNHDDLRCVVLLRKFVQKFHPARARQIVVEQDQGRLVLSD